MAAENVFWTEAAEVVRLFPTFVWKCQLRPEVHRPIDAAIRNRLDEMRRHLSPLDRGAAWQSGHGLHKLEELRGLVCCIDAAVDANASGETRVSVSFNVMFSAFTAALSKPLWGEE